MKTIHNLIIAIFNKINVITYQTQI